MLICDESKAKKMLRVIILKVITGITLMLFVCYHNAKRFLSGCLFQIQIL